MRIDFWTSIEQPGFMESLISELNALGHEARQRFFISEASYRAAKSRPQRLWLRVRQYLLYPAYLKGSLLFGKKAEVVVVCTNTFYAPLLATFFHKRVVHLVYDLFPEALAPEARIKKKEEGIQDEPNSNVEHRTSNVERRKEVPLSQRNDIRPPCVTVKEPSEQTGQSGGITSTEHSAFDVRRSTFDVRRSQSQERLPNRLIRRLVGMTLRRAETNVFLGDHLRDYVLSHYEDVRNPVVIPVGAAAFGVGDGRWDTEDGIRDTEDGGSEDISPTSISNLPSSHHEVVLLYCGNLGRMHDVETVMGVLRSESLVYEASSRAVHGPGSEDSGSEDSGSAMDGAGFSEGAAPAEAGAVKPRERGTLNIFFTFHCSGPKKPQLEAAVADLPAEMRACIRIGGGLGPDEWERVMREADIALVTMIPGAEKVVMPSKTYSAMMAGQAILAIAPEVSDLADTVRRADCGWVIAPGDVTALRQVLQQVRTDPDTLSRFQHNARKYALTHYSMSVLARTWADTLKTLRD